MEFIYSYSFCSLLFLFVIMGVFFSKKQFPTTANKFFAVIVICSFFDISLDILSGLTIERATELPFSIVQTVNATFYALQMMFPLGLLYYVSLIAGWQGKMRNFTHGLLLLPCILIQLALASNPWTQLFFYVDPVTGYTRGKWFLSFYVVAAIYLLLTAIAVIIFRKSLIPLQVATILASICVIISFVGIQYTFPEHLLTGTAIALSIVMMYLVIHNPEHMLDTVTGAFNKDGLDFFMKPSSTSKKGYGVIAFDIIEFYKISNIFGADAGKELIRQVGEFLINLVGKDAWVFRATNHMFLIVLKNDDKFDDVYQKIYNRCNDTWKLGSEEIVTDIHLACVKQLQSVPSIESLMVLINESISPHPDNTGVYVTTIDKDSINSANRKILVEDALKRGLKDDNFEIYYQPIYSLPHGKFTNAEALLRLTDSELGFISPGEFIPIAEKCGLIFDIDELVLSQVCRFISENELEKDLGLNQIEINLSGAEFIRKDLAESIEKIVDSYNVDASQICIEITESVATSSFDSYKDIAKKMRKKGFSFALDDYGTGYANLSQLTKLKFEIAKIDRSLLLAYFNNKESAIIFKHIIDMLKQLGLTVVVEGAEEKCQIDLLTDLGVDLIQGYYYSKPLCEDDFKKFLITHNF